MSSGQYNVSVADANGCTDNASVTVLASAAFTLTSATEVEHCSHSDGSATITANNALYPLTYSWSHNASLNNATASGLQAGSYTVTVSDGTCAVSLTITVGSYAGPVAGFHADHTVLSMEDGPVSFSDMSYDAVSWFYDFGDGDASTDQNPSHLFSNPGTFNTMQIVADEFGCTDTAYQDIIVKEGFAFFVPSAFSPNGDGRNDMFEVYGYGIDLNTFNLAVFDRWGEMVFQTTDINKMWDGGRANAREQEDVAQAVYSYHITFKTLAGKDKEYFGHVVALP
ncbi:hypothetical protein SDC9_161180 [bioreactor metagenome]|uniref:PKD domain-containing protein n=1 Tax=bioreactor metagenome TaxID=1076179 RepID=A0A645FNF8_9ZZZZ